MGGYADQARGTASTQAARGSVRDVLAALQNLEQLLRSPRVGPRALTQVVQEIRPSCQPLGGLFEQVIDQVATAVAQPERVRALSPFAQRRAERLGEALDRAARSDMGARARLALEASVHQLSAELDALRELVELLDAASNFNATELDINAIISHSLTVHAPTDTRRTEGVRVAFLPAAEAATVVTDPRVLMPLIALSVALATREGSAGVEVTTSSGDSGTVIAFGPASGVIAKPIVVVPPRIMTPTSDIARLAAEEIGAELDATDGGPVRLRIPPAQVAQTSVRVPPALRHAPQS